MGTIRQFEDLEIWNRAREFANEIFNLTLKDKFSRDFALKDQILRSTGSVMDNIAEGFERDGRPEFIQFLSIAKGSAGESRSLIARAPDFGYISESEWRPASDHARELSQMIGNMIAYLNRSKMKGLKFKDRI